MLDLVILVSVGRWHAWRKFGHGPHLRKMISDVDDDGSGRRLHEGNGDEDNGI